MKQSMTELIYRLEDAWKDIMDEIEGPDSTARGGEWEHKLMAAGSICRAMDLVRGARAAYHTGEYERTGVVKQIEPIRTI